MALEFVRHKGQGAGLGAEYAQRRTARAVQDVRVWHLDPQRRAGVNGATLASRAADHVAVGLEGVRRQGRSEEHTSELQSLMRISYAVFCLKKKKKTKTKADIMMNKIISIYYSTHSI